MLPLAKARWLSSLVHSRVGTAGSWVHCDASATKYCSAGAMLGKTAKLIHTFRVVEAAPEVESMPTVAALP